MRRTKCERLISPLLTDAGLDVGKAVAARLESIRVLLEEAFPTENRRYRDHVVVHAVSDEQAMARLLPAMWEDENVRKPDGLFWCARHGAQRHGWRCQPWSESETGSD